MFATRLQVRAPLMAGRPRRAIRMRAEVMDDVRDVIAEQLGLDLEKVTPTATFEGDLEADSLDTVEIMMALEEKFTIDIDATGTENIEKVEDVAVLIEKILSGELPAPPKEEVAPAADAAAPAADAAAPAAPAAPAAEKAAPAAEAK